MKYRFRAHCLVDSKYLFIFTKIQEQAYKMNKKRIKKIILWINHDYFSVFAKKDKDIDHIKSIKKVFSNIFL